MGPINNKGQEIVFLSLWRRYWQIAEVPPNVNIWREPVYSQTAPVTQLSLPSPSILEFAWRGEMKYLDGKAYRVLEVR